MLRRIAAVPVVVIALLAVADPSAVAAAPAVVTATSPGGPFISGIAGAGYYAGFSTVTAANPGSSPSGAGSVRVRIPLQTGTASFVVTSALAGKACHFKVQKSAQVWTCPVPALSAGASRAVATIVGSEDSTTGLPTTVVTDVVAAGSPVVPLTWQWILPYSHLTATWSNLPASTDWGAAVPAVLTITNDGNWPTQGSPTVLIKPSDPTAFNAGWTAYSLVSGYLPYYCGIDYSSGVADGVLCSLDPIAAGASQTFNVTSYPVAPSGGSLSLIASDSAGDFTATSPAVAVTGTGANLSLSISNPPSVEAGTSFVRDYTITNTGSTEALGVSLSDGSYAFSVGATTGPGVCAYHSGYRVGGRIDCSFGTVPAHSSITLGATLNAPLVSGSGLTYSAGVFTSTTSPYVAAGATLASTASVAVFNNPVVNLDPPTLTGTPQVGQVLTATWGGWSGTGKITLWAKLCHGTSGGCSSDIASTYTSATTSSGAPSSTAFTYTIPAGDVGTDLVLYVSAANYDNSAVVTTAALGPVTP